MNKEILAFASFGYIIITDVLIFAFISLYIKNKFQLNDYVVIFGILIGLFTSFYTLYKLSLKKARKK